VNTRATPCGACSSTIVVALSRLVYQNVDMQNLNPAAVLKARASILGMLRTQPLGRQAILDACAQGPRTIKHVLEELEAEGLIAHPRNAWDSAPYSIAEVASDDEVAPCPS
jgi:hypothetical protein